MGDSSLQPICEAIEANRSLRFLNLNANGISDLGAKYLASMIRYNNGLSVLFINWNNIRFKGGIDLADALSESQDLQILDISFNSLGASLQLKYNFICPSPTKRDRIAATIG